MENKKIYSFRLSQSDIDLIDHIEQPKTKYYWGPPSRTEKLEQILHEYRQFKKNENQATK